MPPPIPPNELQWQQEHINVSRAPALIATTSVFLAIAVISFVARLVQRFRISSSLGLDDWLMVAAAPFVFAEVLAIYMLTHLGLGKQAIAVDPNHFEAIGKWELVLGFCYAPALALAKLSFIALIARIFTVRLRWLRYSVWALSIYTFLWFVAVTLVVALSCRPLSTNWSTTHPCNPGRTPPLYTGSFSVLGDVLVILLPQPLIWKLHMSWQRKAGVSILITAGLFGTACCIARMALTNELNLYDITYATADVALFFELEVLVAFICGNLPATSAPFVAVLTSAHTAWKSISSMSRSRLSSSRLSSCGSKERKSSEKELADNSDGSSRSAETSTRVSEEPTQTQARAQV